MVPIKASLVKAMLVHSTVPMMGYCAYDHRYCEGFHSWPNTFQGHGRVVLKKYILLSDNSLAFCISLIHKDGICSLILQPCRIQPRKYSMILIC